MSAEDLVARDITCPLCHNSYKFHTPRSHAYRMVRRDTDFCPYYEGPNPLYYAVYVCPNCHFAGYKEHFKGLEAKSQHALKEALSVNLRRFAADFTRPERTSFHALMAYQLAMECYKVRNMPPELLGQVAMRTAWICRYGGQAKRELEYLQQARGHFKEAYDHGVRTTGFIDFQALSYLVGELHLRTGQLDQAEHYFGVLGKKKDLTDPMRIATFDRLDSATAAARLQKYLEAVPILEPLKGQALGILAQRATAHKITEGSVVCEKGAPGGSLFVVMQGQASITANGPASPATGTLGIGEVFEELSLFTGEPRAATLVAGRTASSRGKEEPVRIEIAEVTRPVLHSTLRLFPAASSEITRILNERLEAEALRSWTDSAKVAAEAQKEPEKSLILEALGKLFKSLDGSES